MAGKKNNQIGLRIDDDLMARIKAERNNEDESLADIVRRLMRRVFCKANK
jgi:hypothetical protein